MQFNHKESLVDSYSRYCCHLFYLILVLCCSRQFRFDFLVDTAIEKVSSVCTHMNSPTFLPTLFLCPLPFSGNGNEEHALLSHRVCQEWGDLW